MAYTVNQTAIDGMLMLDPQVFGDVRGYFYESFNQKDFERATGLTVQFVQDNHSLSARGVLRGLHYQVQHPQGKLVRVTQGEVFDAVVDIRPTSPTFGRSVGVRLSADNKRQLWIPPGLAHGFLVLSETADFLYKTTDYWMPEFERSLAWNDPTAAVAWPLAELAPLQPNLAAKDATAKSWDELRPEW
jgi:dTDP-4-dehydrorhamnose 3,5-epimerase